MSPVGDEGDPDRREGELTDLLIRSRWKLLAAFFAFGLIAYASTWLMTPAYRSEALVIPVDQGNSSLVGGLSGLIGGGALASLGLAPNADKNEAIETARSRKLLRQFINNRQLLPVLCKSRAIDCSPDSKKGSALVAERTMDDAVKLFHDDLLSINEDTTSGIIYVSITWYDRVQAAEWCNAIVQLTNQQMQQHAKMVTELRLKYLRDRYATVDVVTVQSEISALIQTELSRDMDSATRPEFALRIVDPAAVADDRYPVRPRKAVIGAAAGVVGAVLAFLVIAIRRRRRA